MELIPGTRLGHYVVTSSLASGGMGSVYRAEHVTLKLPAAIKVLHGELASQPELVTRFEREARAVAMVRHPNVVDVYETGRLPDRRPYFVMELLHGMDLDRRARRLGRMAPPQILGILEPLADALETAHARGVIHRDVKPSNVFLAERDGDTRVVLLDFGVAKLRSREAGEHTLTTARRQLGTPSTMAPEQIRGEPVTPKTDVYGLACVAFHLLTARMPFVGDSAAVEWMHLVAKRPRPSSLAPVPPALDEPILRGLSARAEERPATPRAFVASLHAALGRTPQVSCRALGAHFTAVVDPALLADPDDALCVELEEVLGGAGRQLTQAGFVRAFEARASGLWVRPLPPAGDAERHERGRAVRAALELHRGLLGRKERDPRVRVALALHVDEVVLAGDRVRGGELLRLGGWPERPGRAAGVTASDRVFAGLKGVTSCAA